MEVSKREKEKGKSILVVWYLCSLVFCSFGVSWLLTLQSITLHGFGKCFVGKKYIYIISTLLVFFIFLFFFWCHFKEMNRTVFQGEASYFDLKDVFREAQFFVVCRYAGDRRVSLSDFEDKVGVGCGVTVFCSFFFPLILFSPFFSAALGWVTLCILPI